MGFTWEKNAPSIPQFVDLFSHLLCNSKNEISQPYEGGNTRKSPRRDPATEHYQSNFPDMWKKKNSCNVRKNSLELQKTHEEERMWMNDGMGRCFLGFYLPRKSKHVFHNMMDSPIQSWTAIPFPSPSINQLNHFWMTRH